TPTVALSTGPDPVAVTDDGSAYFADYYTAGWSGIVEIARSSGAMHRIYEFPAPQYQVYQAEFDGRWLVWTLSPQIVNPEPLSLMAWDSRAGTVTTLVSAQAATQVVGFTVATAGRGASDGDLAWSVVDDISAGPTQFFVRSLNSGIGQSVTTSGAGAIGWFIADRYVYTFGRHAFYGATTPLEIAALTVPGWASTNVPVGTGDGIRASLDEGDQPVVTSRGVFWTDRTAGGIKDWAAGETGPVVLISSSGPEFGRSAGRLFGWVSQSLSDGDVDQQYVADLRSGSYAAVNWEWLSATGQELLVEAYAGAPDGSKLNPRGTTSFLSIDSLPPLPGCSHRSGSR
ncbi:MAG: hypothetical protein ACREOD_08215, partial [Candidatus Dormibacteria bacterium]